MFDFLAVSAGIMGGYLLDFVSFLALQVSQIYKLFFNAGFSLTLKFFEGSKFLSNFVFSDLNAKVSVASKFLRYLDDESVALVVKSRI